MPPWIVVRQVNAVYVQKKRVRSVLDESELDHCNQRCKSVSRVPSDMSVSRALRGPEGAPGPSLRAGVQHSGVWAEGRFWRQRKRRNRNTENLPNGEVSGQHAIVRSKVAAPASTPAPSEKQPGSSGKYMADDGHTPEAVDATYMQPFSWRFCLFRLGEAPAGSLCFGALVSG